MTGPVLCLHPGAERYGSDRVFLAAVRALAAHHRVEVVLGGDGPLAADLRAVGANVRVADVLVLRKALLRAPWRLPLALLRDVAAWRRRVRRLRPAAVYVSTVTLPGALLGARLAGAPVLCHVHEAEPLPRPVRTVLLAPLLAAHRVISISGATRGFVVGTLPVLAARVRPLRNPVPPVTAPPALPATAPQPLRLALVGRISERKGTDVAVRATALLRDRGHAVRLDLYGDVFPGYEPWSAHVDALVYRLGLDGAVTRHGVVADTGAAYRDAHVCVVPSRVEPYGLVAVEARLAGRVLVVSDVDGLRETVDGGSSGTLVPPGSPDALADAVEAHLAAWPDAVAAARASGERARVDHHPDRFAAGLHAIVAEVVA
ncbi:glycosyltransferase family 4 protein [Actinomycetospora sp. NBRC 106378]|uniref:glycosyltransferase family 4 protein n=1 Tax=Actinomycetospora sp. NBRC 106378 TaxID=3032208 RepID=UPI0024A21D69|nr:glycosyltransferase family 4 protein [Actinomycetospora sp. NBRC 106378]GLZ51775.1 glycosyl transferase [Actinomycetospora sp. NBRC 106378]